MAIANNPPVTNATAAQKNKAASAIHTMGQLKAGGEQLPTDTSTAQKLGAAFTGEQQQQDVAAVAADASSDIKSIEQEKQVSDINQAGQNIKDQEVLDKSILDQQTKLLEMNIGLQEEDFLNDLDIKQLAEQQDFTNETQLNDLARLTFESDEEYQNVLLDSQQRTERRIVEDKWELSVYERAQASKAIRKKLAKDRAKATEIQRAQAEAARKLEQSQAKAKKQSDAIQVAEVVVEMGVTAYTGNPAAGKAAADTTGALAQTQGT